MSAYREDIFDVLPFAAGVDILLLYLLAFFHGLHAAGFLVCGVSTVLIFLLTHPRVKDPQLLLALLLMTAAAFFAAGRVVTWWDDLNFWASDAKYLWATGGFAGKYGNVCPEFGDYPPAESLWKALFLLLSPRVYCEGLQYAAYHVLNMLFLLPLLRVTRGFHPLPARLLAVPAVFLLPGVVCGLQFAGAAADITMGAVFGALLLALAEREERTAGASEAGPARFRAARIAVYGSVLALTKSTGILWVLAAFFFRLFVCGHIRQQVPRLRLLCAAGLPLLTWGSWILFCLVNRRVAKLTGESLRMARGGFALPEDAGERLRTFAEAFFLWPMHDDRNLTLDLSAGALTGILIITSAILYIRERSGRERAAQRRRGHGDSSDAGTSPDAGTSANAGSPMLRRGRLLCFLVLTAALMYGAILLAHLSIFQTEMQYLEPFAMARSISRYGAPFTLGFLMLLLREIASDGLAAGAEAGVRGIGGRRAAAVLLFLLFPLLAADYAGEARAFITYRADRERELQVREETIDGEGRRFLETAQERADWQGRRILFLRADAGNHRVRDTYLSYEASPLAVVYADYDPAMDEAALRELMETQHAEVVYVDPSLSSQAFYGKIN